jgi:hypothetical protein
MDSLRARRTPRMARYYGFIATLEIPMMYLRSTISFSSAERRLRTGASASCKIAVTNTEHLFKKQPVGQSIPDFWGNFLRRWQSSRFGRRRSNADVLSKDVRIMIQMSREPRSTENRRGRRYRYSADATARQFDTGLRLPKLEGQEEQSPTEFEILTRR